MGVCQSCHNLPATVRHCATTNGCGVDDCTVKVCMVDADSEEVGGMVGVRAMNAMLDRCPGSDPVGAIFEETLDGLGPLERELMLFCATSNVLAVRWLIHLGAHWDALDSNGSSCLHVAARAGSLQVVAELVQYQQLLHTNDISRWTPLHIAAFMGRREAVVRLLRARASPNMQNAARQTPSDVCPDYATLAVLKETTVDYDFDPDNVPDETAKQWQNGFREDTAGAPLECEHIPFFLPPVAAIQSSGRFDELWQIAVLIFNKQPSYGLGFTVAVSLASTYADALMKILQRKNVNRALVGGFLGEALSLSFLTRLSLFDSVPLWNTGVIAALRSVFAVFQLPEDFQKISRLLSGVAQVWWRKHKAMECPDGLGDVDYALESLLLRTPMKSEETSGCHLKVCLASLDALAQLMFSTVLLHWYIHGDGLGGKRELTFSTWVTLNHGLSPDGDSMPLPVQQQIHTVISRSFIKELALATPSDDALQDEAGEVCWERFAAASASSTSGGGPDEAAGRPRCTAWQSALSSRAALEGWVTHCPVGAQTVHHGLPSSMSEVPFSVSAPGVHFSAGRMTPLDSAMVEANRTEALFLEPPKDSKMWLSLCGSLLFFWAGAASSSATPHMFLDLTQTGIYRSQSQATDNGASSARSKSARSSSGGRLNIITFVGIQETKNLAHTLNRERSELGADLGQFSREASTNSTNLVREGSRVSTQSTSRHYGVEPEPFVKVVHLLPDGRWQEIHLTRLELRFATEAEAEIWATRLSASLQWELDTEINLDSPRGKDMGSQRVAEADIAHIIDSKCFSLQSDGDLGTASDGVHQDLVAGKSRNRSKQPQQLTPPRPPPPLPHLTVLMPVTAESMTPPRTKAVKSLSSSLATNSVEPVSPTEASIVTPSQSPTEAEGALRTRNITR